ncbi:MAG TPA: IucA/IucC family protein [Candidatus Bathyarchaeia archaeon]|nr:IucA/IucC family protein [Candidatus Bathyarchaeia archaeon]
MNTIDWAHAYTTEQYTDVEQRVLCQLIEAVLYEEIAVPPSGLPQAGESAGRLVLEGKTKTEEPVTYSFHCQRKFSFGRYRVAKGTVTRETADGESRDAALSLFVEEVLGQVQTNERLAMLLQELEHTLVRDLQAQSFKSSAASVETQRDYDDWEALLDGHPYHPCYKSRIGFSMQENALYGPEFKTDLQPVWLAVSKVASLKSSLQDVDYRTFIEEELGSDVYVAFAASLYEKGLDIADYWIMPVHPWQWEHMIMPAFHGQLADKRIVPLGNGGDYYRAQQSIRSWANISHKEKAYLKMALNIVNTSTKRMLAKHTVLNAPLVSQWLLTLTKHDETAKKLDFVFLPEFAGITYDYEQLPSPAQVNAYGSLGVVYRHSVHRYLKEDEQAFPLSAVSLVDNGQPAIEPWVRKYGLEAWVRQLLTVTVTPLIHMLYAHGLALESHAQNLILIHKDGWPCRLALKDFHDGVRFSYKHLTQPELYPELHREPAHHRAINRHSYIQTDDLAAVKDFLHSAFFFVCMSEMGIFLNERYGLDEKHFWEMVAQVIRQYQEEHPEFHENFERYDLFSKTIQIEQLARRRLWKDIEVDPRPVPNPLFHYRRSLQEGMV